MVSLTLVVDLAGNSITWSIIVGLIATLWVDPSAKVSVPDTAELAFTKNCRLNAFPFRIVRFDNNVAGVLINLHHSPPPFPAFFAPPTA